MKRLLCGLMWAVGVAAVFTVSAATPNFIIIYCDDLGYGDLGCYGHPSIRTPNLDRMAAEGMRFTDFYSACSVCTPSRAALLTGRYPVRNGMCSDRRRVLFPDSKGGLPQSEITMAELLKAKGYATAAVGKWHLGHRPEFLPTQQGFDSYYGIPYSNDMDAVAQRMEGETAAERWKRIFWNPKSEYWNVPLMRDEKIIERPANQTTITKRYTEEALEFIKSNSSNPFFLYFAHSMVHVPLFVSEEFDGVSRRGLYGDAVEEIDWSVGQILDTLRSEGLAENTMVFFSSDNGPWLTFFDHGGTAGHLRDGKGATWDGGMREPGIAWWPGKIDAGEITSQLACTMDLLPTFAKLSGAQLPADRVLDGVDMSPILFGSGRSNRESFMFYRGTKIFAARKGHHKAHFITQCAYCPDPAEAHDPPILYDLAVDPGEQWDVAGAKPRILSDIVREVQRHQATVVSVPSQLELR